MAGADYRHCDVCGEKAFYDANLSYEDGVEGERRPYRIAGAEQYDKPELLEKYGTRLGYVGDWAVICDDCSPKFKTQIVSIEEVVQMIANDSEREAFDTWAADWGATGPSHRHVAWDAWQAGRRSAPALSDQRIDSIRQQSFGGIRGHITQAEMYRIFARAIESELRGRT